MNHMFKNNLKLVAINSLFVLMIGAPILANAAVGGTDFKGIVNLVIKNILDPVVILLIALALVYFMWGVLTYVGRGAEGGDRTKGIQMMSYGILALFIMVSVWGLVYILINTFNLDSSSIPTPPKLN